MPRHVRFCLKYLVLETWSYISDQVIDAKWSCWTWTTQFDVIKERCDSRELYIAFNEICYISNTVLSGY